MKTYILKRLLYMIPTILGCITIVFFASRLIPGDPALAILGENATKEDIALLHQAMGLDKPLVVQYLTFLGDYLRLDFGQSFISGREVITEIMARLPYTIELAVASVIVGVAVGLPLGIIAALKRNSLLDYFTTTISIMGVAAPSFWVGLIFIIVFAIQLGWFPIISSGDETLFSWQYITLPATSLGLSMAALVARLTRSNTLEVLGEDYVRTARAKGVKESKVIFKHVMKNAAVPIITIVGLQMGFLLGGAIITETVFGRPGIGKFLIDSIYARDFPAIQATSFVIVVMFLFINLVVDLLYSVFDPMIRY